MKKTIRSESGIRLRVTHLSTSKALIITQLKLHNSSIE